MACVVSTACEGPLRPHLDLRRRGDAQVQGSIGGLSPHGVGSGRLRTNDPDPAHVEVGGHGLARRHEALRPLTKQRADIIAAAQCVDLEAGRACIVRRGQATQALAQLEVGEGDQ